MSLKSDLRSARTPVGAWFRQAFPKVSSLYPALRDASTPHAVIPGGWGNGTDQRWSWSGSAVGTMLRWQLGDRDTDRVTLAGAVRVQRGAMVVGVSDWAAELDDDQLARSVLGVPDISDLDRASRMAVLWALAEQHVRYSATVNPLTEADLVDPGLMDLVVPAEVAGDVAAIARGPGAAVAETLAGYGPVTFNPSYPYRGGADADLVCGDTLVEVKTTISKPKMIDVLQPVGYALLSTEPPSCVAWAYPRSGKVVRVALDDVLERAAGGSMTVEEVRAGFDRARS